MTFPVKDCLECHAHYWAGEVGKQDTRGAMEHMLAHLKEGK
jgi:hypothetical protein